jgi:polyisoprenoid-binding protein YceI
MKRFLTLLSALLITAAAGAATTQYKLDQSHTKVGFSVAHMVVSSVTGRFTKATAQVLVDDQDLTKSSVSVEIQAASVDTDDAARDEHLRGSDFFDVKKFPTIKFKSTKLVKVGKKYALSGDLTIRDVTKSVTLDATISDLVKTPFNTQIRAVTLSGKIKRSDFGLKWNKVLDAGGLAVGDEVTLDVTAEIVK